MYTTHGKPQKNHKGRIFSSIAEMCEYWDIPYVTYYQRKQHGWKLKDILTTPVNFTNSKPCKDHLGNEFPSVTKMCEYWHVPYATFFQKKSSGKSLQDILETKTCPRKKTIKPKHVPEDIINIQLILSPESNEIIDNDTEKIIKYLLYKNNLDIIEYWLTHGMNLSDTAKQFNVHRNTIDYRIRQLMNYGVDIHSIDGLYSLTSLVRRIKISPKSQID